MYIQFRGNSVVCPIFIGEKCVVYWGQQDNHYRRHSELHLSREKEQKTLPSTDRENYENILLFIDNQL